MLPSSRLLLFVASACALCTMPAHAAGPVPSATPGKVLQSVPVVSDGKTAFRIVVRKAKSPAVDFAAAELAKYVERISGARLATDDGAKPGPRIVLGLRSDLSAADRKLLPKPGKGSDGYSIAVTAEAGGFARIVLGGDEPRGVVYGVYDLLERLGCRFAQPALDAKDPEVVPSSATLTLAAGAWSVASPMKYRALAWFVRRAKDPNEITTTPEQLVVEIDWAMKARYNVLESSLVELPPSHPLARALHAAKQRGMLLQERGHNFDLFLPSDPKTFAEHPDWFGMRNGKRVPQRFDGAQFCWTNHGAQQRFIDNVVAFVRERPDLDILSLSSVDGGSAMPPCSCDVCSKRSPTDNALALLNAVAARLAKEAPHVVVETLGGYAYGETPPKDVKPDPRLRVSWAHWGRPPTSSYSSKQYFQRRAELESWAHAFDGRLTVFQYYSDHFANSWLTAPLAQQIEGDRRYLLQLGVDGMLNLLYPAGYWWRSSLNAYLAGRSFYDASLDPYAVLREYALAYYGPAGEPMAAYLDEWAHNPVLGMRSRDRATPQNRQLLHAQRQKYLEPATALAKSEPLFAARVAKMESLHHLAETIMDVDVARREAEGLKKLGERDQAHQKLERARQRLTEAVDLAHTLTATNTGLVDDDIGFSVFGAKTRAIETELKALDQQPASPQPEPAGTRPQPSAAAAGPAVPDTTPSAQ